MRKYEALDLMKLFSLGSANGWNDVLTECTRTRDINRLTKLRYQLQAGMDDLAKLKLNTEEMVVWYLRLMRSLELTSRRILKKKHPFPGDNPINEQTPEGLAAKRKRDQEFNQFLHDSSY